MTIQLNPQLGFTDNAAEAMAFYQSVFGGTLEVFPFADTFPGIDDADRDKVMHSTLTTERGLVLMGADTPTGMEYTPRTGAPIALTGDEEDVLRGYWDALSAEGTIITDLAKAPWGDYFGMCVDKYGVEWMLDIGEPG